MCMQFYYLKNVEIKVLNLCFAVRNLVKFFLPAQYKSEK